MFALKCPATGLYYRLIRKGRKQVQTLHKVPTLFSELHHAEFSKKVNNNDYLLIVKIKIQETIT
jgi:hypothetical protein